VKNRRRARWFVNARQKWSPVTSAHCVFAKVPLQRNFRHFRLLARQIGAPTYTEIYATPIGKPYTFPSDPGFPNQRQLKRCPTLRERQAQEFRAEFTQDGCSQAGPRVIEPDGLDFIIHQDGFE